MAAVIDCEGYISIERRPWAPTGAVYYTLMLGMNNTSMALLERVRAVAGVGAFRDKRVTPRCRPARVWACYGREAAMVIRAIEPLLVVKREQARLGLELQATKLGPGFHRPPAVARRQAVIYARVKLLNARGTTMAGAEAPAVASEN